jgi:hypothetical protein
VLVDDVRHQSVTPTGLPAFDAPGRVTVLRQLALSRFTGFRTVCFRRGQELLEVYSVLGLVLPRESRTREIVGSRTSSGVGVGVGVVARVVRSDKWVSEQSTDTADITCSSSSSTFISSVEIVRLSTRGEEDLCGCLGHESVHRR